MVLIHYLVIDTAQIRFRALGKRGEPRAANTYLRLLCTLMLHSYAALCDDYQETLRSREFRK